jgi:hypothetical protein
MQANFSASLQQFERTTWRNVVRCDTIFSHPTKMALLHAGPPLTHAIPKVIQHAAKLALLFEGYADSMEAAGACIDRGEILFIPAQDVGIVTPLAQVVSPSMALAEVSDGAHSAYAPLVESVAPAMRFGSSDDLTMQRLHQITEIGLNAIAPILQINPLALGPIVVEAMANGDECHSKTAVANRLLVSALSGLSIEHQAFIERNPSFVLPILMAAAKTLLLGPQSKIHSVGGNGHSFGIRYHHESNWRTIKATPPTGTRFSQHAEVTALGAIGDSAVIDFCGLGGQAIAVADDLLRDWQHVLPAHVVDIHAAIIDPLTGFVDIERVATSQKIPIVHLAILDDEGQHGLIGKGFYQAEASNFIATFCA